MSRGEGELLLVPKPRAVRLLSVCLAVKPVGGPDVGDRNARSRRMSVTRQQNETSRTVKAGLAAMPGVCRGAVSALTPWSSRAGQPLMNSEFVSLFGSRRLSYLVCGISI